MGADRVYVRVYYPRIGEKTRVDEPQTRETRFYDYESKCFIDQRVTSTLKKLADGWYIETRVENKLIPSSAEVTETLRRYRSRIELNYTISRLAEMKRTE